MQLASILPPSNGHQRVTCEPKAMTMPGTEAHINVQSQDESHVMIDYFTAKAEPNYMPNHSEITITIPNHQ